MDEQENQPLDSPQTVSEGESKTQKRANRRRNRKRRSRGSSATAEASVQNDAQEVAAEQPQPQSERRPLTGNAAKQKRRGPDRRHASQEATVYQGPSNGKASVPTLAPLQPMRLRQIDPSDTSEPMFGCPMLTRTRMGIPFRNNQRVARCSAGWSVHDEDEVLLCMHTPTAAQCWKEHPEYLEKLVEELRPIIEAELATEESAD